MAKAVLTLKKQKEEEKENNVVEFTPKLITGGKEPPSTTGDNWLAKLPVGSVFLAQHKNQPMDFQLTLFRLSEKTEKGVVLQTPAAPSNVYVDPNRFCNLYRMFEDLGTLANKEEEKEAEDDGDRVQGDTPAATPPVE